MRKPSFMLCAVLLLAALGAHAGSPQEPASSREIRAHIIDGFTGQAVERARYAVTSAVMVDALTGSSDSEGNLALSGISPGRYRLTIEKAGYFPETYDLNIAESSPTAMPDIVMTARREISGVVRWQDAEVSARATVRVFGIRGARPVARPDIPTVQTNDRGEFVVSNLRPGRYILLVSPPTFSGGIDATGKFDVGGLPRLGLPVFYPGVNVADASTAIDVRGTLSVENIGVVFEEKPGTVVEGTVVPSSTAPMGSEVVITLSNEGFYSVSTTVRAGEDFRIGPVPSGFYLLDASSQAGRAVLPLTIGGATFSGVSVSIPPPTFLSGQVEIDDPSVPPTANITLESAKSQGTFGGAAGANGEFHVSRAVAGESYSMTVDPRSLPPNAYIAAVSQGEQRLGTSPFQVSAGDEIVRIVLKTDGGVIEGSVKDPGRTVGQAFVVLAPKDRRVEQNFRTATTNSEGLFKISAIMPGDYDLFAFDRNEDDDYLGEAFLEGFAGGSVEMKVPPGATLAAELALLHIPRR